MAIVVAICITAAPFYLGPIVLDWSGSVFIAWFDRLSRHDQHTVETIGRMFPSLVVLLMGAITAIGIGWRARRAGTTPAAEAGS